MDGDSTISIRDVKMEDGTPSATDLATASPHPPTATSTTNSHTADNDDRGKSKPAASSGTPYRSWKKKHQKMRIAFEEKMELNAKLHAQEVMAIQTSKRLAVEIDRVLDLLLDVNNSPQIPGNKRIDLGLPSSDKAKLPSLDIDQKGGWERRFYDKNDPQATDLLEPPTKSLQTLLHEVRHVDLAAAKRSMPLLLRDLEPGDDNKLAFVVPVDKNAPPQQQRLPPLYPESFLSADDIDNYLWEVDRTVAGRALLAGLAPPPMLPTLAPFAHAIEMHAPSVSNGSSNGSGATTGWEEFFNRSISNGDLPSMCGASASVTTRDSILRNPTSVFNWLKKNAPRAVFLQEGEATAAAAADKENNHAHAHANGDEYHHYSYMGGGGAGQNGTGSGTTARGRKSTGGGGRGGARGRAKPMAEVVNAASDRERVAGYLAAGDADSDGDLSFELTTPRTMGTAGGRGGKRKRAAQDDDAGYRPKAGAAAGAAGSAGGSGRATKRKRKSEGGAGAADAATASPSTTSATAAKKARKSGDGVTAAAAAAAAASAAKSASTAGADGEDTEMASGEGDGDGDVDADADTRADGEDLEDVEDDEDADASVVDQEAVSVEA